MLKKQVSGDEYEEVSPLVVDGVHKVVAYHYGMEIDVKVGEKTYNLTLDQLANANFQIPHHTFTIRYNKDATDLTKVLTIENHKAEDRNK